MVGTDGPHFKTNRVGDVIDLIKPEILKASGDFTLAALEVLGTEPKVPILAGRKETFYWRYQTIVNHPIAPLDEVIAQRRDVQDPDVDFQLAAVEEKPGLSGDALRADMLKSLMAGKDQLAASKGLSLFGSQASTGGFSMWGRGPSKTTVVVGLRGLAALRDDPRWADVFARQGMSFAAVDAADPVFVEAGLSEDGRKLVESLGKTSLVLVVRGLNPAQAKALLENAKKPVCLVAEALPEKAVLDLVKKTESTIGLIRAESETAAAYVTRLDEAKRALGSEYVAIVNRESLWEKAEKDAMLGVIAELLKLKYEATDLANLFSGSLQRVLTRASQP
jgi:hypothetical protein